MPTIPLMTLGSHSLLDDARHQKRATTSGFQIEESSVICRLVTANQDFILACDPGVGAKPVIFIFCDTDRKKCSIAVSHQHCLRSQGLYQASGSRNEASG